MRETFAMSRPTWALLSGEYPPHPGGVADYSRSVARGLADGGDDVHVFSSACDTADTTDPGVELHRLRNHFGITSLTRLDRALRRLPKNSQIVVEYTPHAFGYRAMNLPFCAWLATRHRHRYWAMFHEVAFPFIKGQPWKHLLLAMATKKMASMLANNAGRVFISIQQWKPILERSCKRMPPCHWLPVPSNVPCESDASRVSQIRGNMCVDGSRIDVIGHFGTFEQSIAGMLSRVLPGILQAHPGRIGLMIGRGSNRFAKQLVSEYPELSERVVATGGLPAAEIANHLAACDLLVQPYPGGACTRRGTLMAGIGLGLPVLSNTGEFSDSVFRQTAAIEVVPEDDLDLMVQRVTDLLTDDRRRDSLGQAAAALYQSTCSVENAVNSMRSYHAKSLP